MLLFSHSVMSESLQPHGLQHARLPCPSLSPWVYSSLCPLSRWCHPTTSSSVTPFSPCPQSSPASASFPMRLDLPIRWPKYWHFRFSFSPSNEYSGLISFRMDWLDLPAVQETLKSLFQYQSTASCWQLKSINSSALSLLYGLTPTSIHGYWKNHSLDYNFVGKLMSLPFNTLSRLVIAFLPRSKH